jgi:hypothetical protein
MSGAQVDLIDNFSTITPANGPVGTSFDGGNPDSWPGVSGNASDQGNFFPYNSDKVVDPPMQSNSLIGGKKRRTHKRNYKKSKKAKKSTRKSLSKRSKSKSKRQSSKRKYIGKRKSHGKKRGRRATKKMHGGSSRDLIGMPVRNAYRNIIFGAGELVNNWNGKPTPISSDPSPLNQPLSSGTHLERSNVDVDLNAIGTSADNAVANM